MPGIDPVVSNHFIIFFRDMLYEPPHEFQGGNGFVYQCIIFMAVIVERNRIAIIAVNPGGGDHRAPQVTPNVFYNLVGFAFLGLGIDIKAVFMLVINVSLCFFKGISQEAM